MTKATGVHLDASLISVVVNDLNTQQSAPEASQFVLRFVLDGSGASSHGTMTVDEMLHHGLGLKFLARDQTLGTDNSTGTDHPVEWPGPDTALQLDQEMGPVQGPAIDASAVHLLDSSHGLLEYAKATTSRLVGRSNFPNHHAADGSIGYADKKKYVGVVNKLNTTDGSEKVLLSVPIDVCLSKSDISTTPNYYKNSTHYGYAPIPLESWGGKWGDEVKFEIKSVATGNTHVETVDDDDNDGASEVFTLGGDAAIVPLKPLAGAPTNMAVSGKDKSFTIDFNFHDYYGSKTSTGSRGSAITHGVVKFSHDNGPAKTVNVPLTFSDLSDNSIFEGNDLSSGHIIIGGETGNIAGWGSYPAAGSNLDSGTYVVSLAMVNGLGQSKYSTTQTVTVGSAANKPTFTSFTDVSDVHSFAVKLNIKTNATSSAPVTKMSIRPIDFSAGLYEREGGAFTGQVNDPSYDVVEFTLADPEGKGQQADISFIIGNASSYGGDHVYMKSTQYVELSMNTANNAQFLKQGQPQYFKIVSSNTASGSESTETIFGPVFSTAVPFEPTEMTVGKLSWDFSNLEYRLPDTVGDLSFNLPTAALLDASCGIDDLSSVRITTYYDFSSARVGQDPSAGWLNTQLNSFTLNELGITGGVSAEQVITKPLSELLAKAPNTYIGNDVSYNLSIAFSNNAGVGKDLSNGDLDLSGGVVSANPLQFTATANPTPIVLADEFTTIDRTNNVAVYKVNYTNNNIDTSQNLMNGSSVGVKWNLYDVSYRSYTTTLEGTTTTTTATDPSYDALSFAPAQTYDDAGNRYFGASGEVFTDLSKNATNGSSGDTFLRFSFRDFSDNFGGQDKAQGKLIHIRLLPISTLYPQYLSGLDLGASGNFQLLDTINPAANFTISCAKPSSTVAGKWDISLSFTGTSGEQYLVTQGASFLNTSNEINDTYPLNLKASENVSSQRYYNKGAFLTNNSKFANTVIGVPDASGNATIDLTVEPITDVQEGTIGSEVNSIFVQARDASDGNFAKAQTLGRDYVDEFVYYGPVQMPSKTLVTDLPPEYGQTAEQGLRVGHRAVDISQNALDNTLADISCAEFIIQSNLGGQAIDDLKLGKLYIVNDASTTEAPLYTIDLKALTVAPATGTRAGLHADMSAVDVSLQVVDSPNAVGSATIGVSTHLDNEKITRWSVKMPFVGLDEAKNFLYIADIDNDCSEVTTAQSQKQVSTKDIDWTA